MKNLPIFISLFFYTLSLASPTFLFIETHYNFSSSWIGPSPAVWRGLTVLLMGWLGFVILQFGWLANPLYYLSLYFLWASRWRAVIISSGIAIVIAIVNTLLLFQQTVPGDVMGFSRLNLQRLKLGYYLWATALLIPLVWSLIKQRE